MRERGDGRNGGKRETEERESVCVGGRGGCSLSREKGEKKGRAGEWVSEGGGRERDGRKGMECVG